ncbi:MAG: hypothetical protein ACQEQN_07510, partial [Thermodesulfobacteriota bacterium]
RSKITNTTFGNYELTCEVNLGISRQTVTWFYFLSTGIGRRPPPRLAWFVFLLPYGQKAVH